MKLEVSAASTGAVSGPGRLLAARNLFFHQGESAQQPSDSRTKLSEPWGCSQRSSQIFDNRRLLALAISATNWSRPH